MTERFPWFPCNPSKLLGALAGMPAHIGYVYTVVLLRIYEIEGPCPDAAEVLALRTHLTARQVRGALDHLLSTGKLVMTEAGIRNPVADQILETRKATHERLAKAGAKGGKKSARKKQQNQTPAPTQAAAKTTPASSILEIEEDSVSPKGETPSGDWPDDYRERFWAKYPRRTAKKAALSKLDLVRKSGEVPWDRFWAGLDRYCESVRMTDQRYIKQPATWINGGCWDDEYPNLPNGGANHEADRRQQGTRGGGFGIITARLRAARQAVPEDHRGQPADLLRSHR